MNNTTPRVSLASPFSGSMDRFHVEPNMLDDLKKYVWRYRDLGTTVAEGNGQTMKSIAWCGGLHIRYVIIWASDSVELMEVEMGPPPPPKNTKSPTLPRAPSRSRGVKTLTNIFIKLLTRWIGSLNQTTLTNPRLAPVRDALLLQIAFFGPWSGIAKTENEFNRIKAQHLNGPHFFGANSIESAGTKKERLCILDVQRFHQIKPNNKARRTSVQVWEEILASFRTLETPLADKYLGLITCLRFTRCTHLEKVVTASPVSAPRAFSQRTSYSDCAGSRDRAKDRRSRNYLKFFAIVVSSELIRSFIGLLSSNLLMRVDAKRAVSLSNLLARDSCLPLSWQTSSCWKT